MKKVISTKSAPAAIGPYSQAIEANGFIFCSGQIPLDPSSGQLVTGDVQVQTKRVMENIRELLKAVQCDFKHVVKSTVFLSDMNHFPKMNEIYGEYFPENPPARSTVAVKALPKGADVEVEVIVCRPH